jgi:hypothetical protein
MTRSRKKQSIGTQIIEGLEQAIRLRHGAQRQSGDRSRLGAREAITRWRRRTPA